MRSKFLFWVLLLSSNEWLPIAANATQPKIVIVGAGVAGIAAATTLLNNGFTDVTILEAKSRIGGRIHTVPFAKNVIDLGAYFVHGEEGNIVYELAAKHNSLEHSSDEAKQFTYMRSNAQFLAKPVWQRLEKITEDIEEERKKNLPSYKGSLGQYMREKFEKNLALPQNADIDRQIAKEYYDNYEKSATADEGANSLYQISARDYAEYEENDGDAWMYWKDKGSIELLRLLMESTKEKKEFGILDGRIKLAKPVVHIKWQQHNQKALLTTQTGDQYEADHVIVTVSLGVLKSFANDMFTPKLPASKLNAIKAFGFGGGNKIFLELKKPFWQPDWQGGALLWRDEHLNEIRGTNRSWLEGLTGFLTVPHQPNVLFSWIVGNHSRHIEVLENDEIKAGCLYLLNKFWPAFAAKDIVNMQTSTWTTDPCFFGGFSFHALETEQTNANNQQLAEPVKLENGKPILQFAGEATVRDHYATVHGAMESGIREAKRLTELYK